MIYTIRTTPLAKCDTAVVQADRVIEATASYLLGAGLSGQVVERARLPTRLGGLALQSLTSTADAAYAASFMEAAKRIEALTEHRRGGNRASLDSSDGVKNQFLQGAVERVASRLPGGRAHLEGLTDNGEDFRQQRVSLALREADAKRLIGGMNALDAGTFQAGCAPGSCRWLLPAPASEGDDKLLTSSSSLP
jgi:hypothetical protein